MTYKKSIFLTTLFFGILFFGGCNSYDKLLKSNDVTLKYKAALEFFDKGNYSQAVPLLEDVYKFYIGTAQAETVSYDLAYSYYKVGEYSLGAFQFKTFADGYPLSKYTQDANYYYAYCLYLDSPDMELDQGSTRSAINAFQLFIDKYPDSKRVEECNKNIDALSNKLEQKEINNAVLYYKIEQYKAAVWAIRNALEDYPATKDKEHLSYLVVKSSYLYALNSVEEKKIERLTSTLEYYSDFKEKFPKSAYDSELGVIVKDCNRNIKQLTKK